MTGSPIPLPPPTTLIPWTRTLYAVKLILDRRIDSFQVTDPTSANRGAGAGPNFDGHLQAARGFKETAGVVEGRPGVIETANIDPLNQNSNKGAHRVH